MPAAAQYGRRKSFASSVVSGLFKQRSLPVCLSLPVALSLLKTGGPLKPDCG